MAGATQPGPASPRHGLQRASENSRYQSKWRLLHSRRISVDAKREMEASRGARRKVAARKCSYLRARSGRLCMSGPVLRITLAGDPLKKACVKVWLGVAGSLP